MAALSRLGRQIEELVGALNRLGVRFALIGGLALTPHKVIRATQDIDMLTDAISADDIDQELLRLGYRCIHRSAEAGNYLRGDERVDFLYAHRPAARHLLAGAAEFTTPFGVLRVVSPEGLIGFKLQALVNDPRRTQHLADIRALIRANRATLNMADCASSSDFSIARPCSRSFAMTPSSSDRPLLASDAGVVTPPTDTRDPFTALDDLMAVIDALCPQWPARSTAAGPGSFRL